MLGLPEDRFDLQRALWLAVMAPDLAEMPNGLATKLGAEGVRLSGGQRRRTAAARMFVREPALRRADRILLLQEGRVLATGALDDLLALDEMQRLWHGQLT
jgi:ATP-binding cassette, subfamily B, bacterial